MVGTGGSHRTIATVLTARDRASRKLDDVEESADEAADSVERTEQRLDGMTRALGVAGGATVALGGSIALLTRRFGQLDQVFQTIETTSGATAEEMEKVRTAAKNVSTALPVTLDQTTRAMQALSFAGLSASESMSALSETSQLAIAGNMGAAQSAEIVAQSLNAFQLEAEQANAVVGALGATFSNSTTRIQELAQALTMVQATASAAGISAAGTIASLGVLADTGLQASRAGTSLNAVLSRLTGSSSETQKALDELGLSMSDFTTESGELQGVTSIMATLSERMEGLDSQAERIRLAQQLAGREGARALLPLIQQTDKLEQKLQSNLRAQIQGAVGDISEMNEQELSMTSQALGMESLSGETTTQQLISNLQELNEQGESTAEIVSRLQVGLDLTDEAARALATDITQTNKSADELAESIGGVVTAEELAQKQTETLQGQITQLRADLQVLGYEMFQGTVPATRALVSGLRSITTPLAQNETAARALGTGLVIVTGALGVATVALGSMVVQLKLATLAEKGLVTQTYAGAAAMKLSTAATLAKNKATWLLTASTTDLLLATMARTEAAWLSVSAYLASAKAALADASAKGVMTTATLGAASAVTTLWAALGPIGWLVLGLTAGIAGLAAVMKTDFMGAGEEAGAVLGWFGTKAGQAWEITKQLLGILYELGRIGATIGGMALLAPIAGLLKLPGVINNLGPEVEQAAAQLPEQIIAGLGNMGPAKYALPMIGPLLLARDMLTDSGMWMSAGEQIPMMLAEGIARKAGIPVDEVSGMVAEAREFLPFSPAKRGPLQSLDQTGPALVSTIAEGVEGERNQLASAVETTLGSTPLGMAAEGAASAVGSATGGPTYDVTINNDITIPGEGGTTEESVEQAAEAGTSSGLDEFFERLARET